MLASVGLASVRYQARHCPEQVTVHLYWMGVFKSLPIVQIYNTLFRFFLITELVDLVS